MQDTIAVVFDFDDTLGPDSTSAFLASIGVDVRRFWNETVEQLINDGWDPIPAYLYSLLRLSERGQLCQPITRNDLQRFGARALLFPGVTRIFESLRRHLKALDTNIQIEFYLISSGIGEILRNTRIAKHFTDIWACDYAYSADGHLLFPKNVVSFTDKTRYLFYISKGLHASATQNKPF